MLLISLILAAASPPALKPEVGRREGPRARPAARAVRSKRLIELEAVVRSLPLAVAERGQGSGPEGM
ncbi:MAG TPA: hypothetical protein VF718_10060 [Allosphingosinicella sp.]|jgi:hypothetical protein